MSHAMCQLKFACVYERLVVTAWNFYYTEFILYSTTSETLSVVE